MVGGESAWQPVQGMTVGGGHIFQRFIPCFFFLASRNLSLYTIPTFTFSSLFLPKCYNEASIPFVFVCFIPKVVSLVNEDRVHL